MISGFLRIFCFLLSEGFRGILDIFVYRLFVKMLLFLHRSFSRQT